MAVRKPLVLIGGVHKELPAADSLAVGWAWITGTPTTLAGYGITDAAPLSHVGAGGTAHANVVAAGAAGFMTGADKTKLDGVATGATANTGTVTSVAVANATGITWTGSPITTSGTLTPTLSANLQAWSGLATSSKANISGTVTLVDTNFRIATDASNNYIQSSTGNQVAGSWKDLVFGPFSSVTAHFKVTATGSLINGNSVWHAGNDTALGSEASTASTIVRRNAASDIFARLFRSTYGNQTTISGAMAYRVNTTDNYIRFCSDTAAIRTFLNVPAFGANANFAHLESTSSRIVIQNAADGTNARGIFLWSGTDANWGIYMSTAGAGKSLAGGTACTSLSGRTAHHARFRAGNATTHGFIWENQAEACLMSLDGDTGRLRVAGNIDVNGAFLGAWPGSTTYKGLIAADGSYLCMTGSVDPNTYVGAQATKEVILRPNANDAAAEVRVASAGFYTTKPHLKLNAAGGAYVTQPRIFVQSADPGTAAADGDLWFW